MNAATGQNLSEMQGWQRPADLVTGFAADILQTSGGMARYEIIERIERNEFPAKTDGFRYTPESYLALLRGAIPPHQPQDVDYQAILDEFNILERVAQNKIDEVWLFAFPHAGLYESVMAGPGAFWCNAPALKNTSAATRRFVLMGFSFERAVGEMLEAFTHRSESIMEKTFSRTQGNDNLWERFTRYDLKNPGQANIGTVHFAPNSERAYDWANPRSVPSNCDDWYNFPDFRGITRQVNASEWGNGDIRLHHQWWLKHLPHVAGRINGIHNNWWQYVMNPNKVIV
ncbi:MAG: hypothetical protein L3J16_05385, partial [Anaerolineales bacterium]|nr:hypothetical protein [Anaerolineales bacterium]